ncbi:MAG: penicillin acylase family protein [Bacteroidota bacterium]
MGFLDDILGRLLKPVVTGRSTSNLALHEGSRKLKGLKDEVEIRRDPRGVPYIYANHQADAFFAQGFVHCQDRLWQMEVSRRVAEGRIAEIFGTEGLDVDRASRTLGLNHLAQQDLELLSEEMKGILEAYVSGINACLDEFSDRMPVEFSLAGYKPEPWTVLQVLAHTRLMTMQLSHGWGHELARMKMYSEMDPELAAEFEMGADPANPIAMPEGIEFNRFGEDDKLAAMQGDMLGARGGSNAWAVSGDRTATGKPFLCGDPHLGATAPGVWYLVYLEAPGMRVQGTSVPGLPMVMIGHNDHVAWSITVAFTDIQDLFVEQFEAPESDRYRYKEEWHEAEIREERIQIKGKEIEHVERVRVTRNGPLVSPLYGKADQHLALRSPALQPATLTLGYLGMNQAGNWKEFSEALRHVVAPGLCIVYSDVAGNIGHWVTGKTPIRSQGHGQFPQDGATGEYEWVGEVPFEEMPHQLNPERGYVISANHKIIGDDFPHYLGNGWMNGYRAQRIEQLLLGKAKWSLRDFGAVHADVLCLPGLEFIEHFRGMDAPSAEHVAFAWKLMLKWDGYLTRETVGGSIYKVTQHEMVRVLYAAAGGEDKAVLSTMLGNGPDPIVLRVNEFHGKETVTLLRMLKDPNSKVVAAAGGKYQLMQTALYQAVAWLENNMGGRTRNWQWGNVHQVEFRHVMATKKPMDHVFNVGPFPIAGDTDTVCQTSSHPDSEHKADLALPSYRQIIDLADFNKSCWVLPPGQSGQLGHPNYDDQVEAWLEGEYFPMLWERKSVEREAKTVLNLHPKE